MIITTIKIHGRSVQREEIVQTISTLAEQLMRYPGCLRADLYQDLEDRDTLYFVEEWASDSTMEASNGSRNLTVIQGITTLISESLEMKHATRIHISKEN